MVHCQGHIKQKIRFDFNTEVLKSNICDYNDA